MIHTAELITKITYEDYYNLLQKEKRKIDNDGNLYLYTLNSVGITRIHAYPQRLGSIYIYWCKIIINLNRVANKGKQTHSPFIVGKENIAKLKANFKKFMNPLLPANCNLFSWDIQRIDYTIDIKTPYVKEYIKLLQRGDKPPKAKIDNESQHKKEIEKTHYPNSVRYKNKSTTINIYNKFEERKSKRYRGRQLEKCKNILRVEIQCFKRKTIALKRKSNKKGNGLKALLIDEEQQKTIFKYYLGYICGKSNYYEYAKAIKKIEDSNHHQKTKTALKDLLRAISKNKSVWKTRIILGKNKCKPLFPKLSKLNINPTTIPRRWGKSELINIYNLIN